VCAFVWFVCGVCAYGCGYMCVLFVCGVCLVFVCTCVVVYVLFCVFGVCVDMCDVFVFMSGVCLCVWCVCLACVCIVCMCVWVCFVCVCGVCVGMCVSV